RTDRRRAGTRAPPRRARWTRRPRRRPRAAAPRTRGRAACGTAPAGGGGGPSGGPSGGRLRQQLGESREAGLDGGAWVALALVDERAQARRARQHVLEDPPGLGQRRGRVVVV